MHYDKSSYRCANAHLLSLLSFRYVRNTSESLLLSAKKEIDRHLVEDKHVVSQYLFWFFQEDNKRMKNE